MAEAAHEYHSGDQDVTEQLATFRAFGGLTKWSCLAIAVLLTMLVIWFCVGAGFFAGLVPGVVILAIGVFFLRSRAEPSH
jgi:hypothetical protein